MEDQAIVLMEREADTGFLTAMRGSFMIPDYSELVDKIYVTKEEAGEKVYLYLTIDRDAEDWEFDAILDSYDMEKIEALGCTVSETDEYNPVWEVVMDYSDNHSVMEPKLIEIIFAHGEEWERVKGLLPELKSEYEEVEE